MKTTIAFLALFGAISHAGEVDQFTRRSEPLADSAQVVNARANEYVASAISALNESGSGCQEEKLYKELRKYFSNHKKGELTKFALHDESVARRTIRLDQSIFKEWTIWDGYLLGRRSAATSPLALSPLIRLGDHVVGTDKLEHIFGRGFIYFKKHYLKAKSSERAIKSGVFGEKTIFGGNKGATGVFSYADLSANFNGMRFWNHMLQLRADILGPEHEIGPYIACENQKWIKVKDIDFKDYVDETMDEAMNCSKFPTKRTLAKYEASLAEQGFSCPLDPAILEAAALKYGEFARWIINPKNGEISYFGEFKGK
jgi:hypothetical protein